MPALRTSVQLLDDSGQRHVFLPGDDVPEWARAKITNPKAWDDYEPPVTNPSPRPVAAGGSSVPPEDTTETGSDEPVEQSEPDSTTPSDTPARSGPGSGRGVWSAYARRHGMDISNEDSRDDIIEACERHGLIPTAE